MALIACTCCSVTDNYIPNTNFGNEVAILGGKLLMLSEGHIHGFSASDPQLNTSPKIIDDSWHGQRILDRAT